jgi:hypothetical protein
MKKILIFLIITIVTSLSFLSGCTDVENHYPEPEEEDNEETFSEKILGSWERNDGPIWTFYENGSISKSYAELGLFWTTYEIHGNTLTEYHKTEYRPIFTIKFEGVDKLTLTNTENYEIFYFIKYM